MAQHYKDRSTYLYTKCSTSRMHHRREMGPDQQQVIPRHSRRGPDHAIVITGAGWGSYNNLKHVPVYRDDNLIIPSISTTLHVHPPGASWTDPSMEPLAGVPFPYDAGPIPRAPRS